MTHRQQLIFITASFVVVGLIVLGMRWSVLANRVPLPVSATSEIASQTNTEPASTGKSTDKSKKYQPGKYSKKQPAKAKPSAKNPVNINQASAYDLEVLPGIGPVLARRIVAYRKANGAFSKLEDLDKVEGIGQKKLDELKGRLEFKK